MLLRTERLVLRRLEPSDALDLFELDSDAEVRRYVHAGPPDLDRIRDELLPRMTSYYDRDNRLGFWAAEGEADGGVVGWFHLTPGAGPEGAGSPELGFRLRRQAWGRGLATEGSRSLVARAFAEPETTRVVAVALVDNLASQRVLEKVGFERNGEFVYEPPPHAVVEYDKKNQRAFRYVLTRRGDDER